MVQLLGEEDPWLGGSPASPEAVSRRRPLADALMNCTDDEIERLADIDSAETMWSDDAIPLEWRNPERLDTVRRNFEKRLFDEAHRERSENGTKFPADLLARNRWVFPAGTMTPEDVNEDPWKAAIRNFHEETRIPVGYVFRPWGSQMICEDSIVDQDAETSSSYQEAVGGRFLQLFLVYIHPAVAAKKGWEVHTPQTCECRWFTLDDTRKIWMTKVERDALREAIPILRWYQDSMPIPSSLPS